MVLASRWIDGKPSLLSIDSKMTLFLFLFLIQRRNMSGKEMDTTQISFLIAHYAVLTALLTQILRIFSRCAEVNLNFQSLQLRERPVTTITPYVF
jgi:hypothetical protein